MQQRYRIDGPRPGTRIWTPHGVVSCDPLGAHMGEHVVSYLQSLGYDPIAVEEPVVTLEITVPATDVGSQALIAQEHAARAQAAAAQAAIEAQAVSVPISASVHTKPGRARLPLAGQPMRGEDI